MNRIKTKNPLHWIKYRYLEWRWDRILKRSGCQNWEHYFRVNDPDFCSRAQTINDQFCGYPYIAVVPFKHLDVIIDGMWGPIQNGQKVVEWCQKYCKHKFRWQWERVIMDHNGHYAPNGIGGTDELFVGFKNSRDYTMFMLRWS